MCSPEQEHQYHLGALRNAGRRSYPSPWRCQDPAAWVLTASSIQHEGQDLGVRAVPAQEPWALIHRPSPRPCPIYGSWSSTYGAGLHAFNECPSLLFLIYCFLVYPAISCMWRNESADNTVMLCHSGQPSPKAWPICPGTRSQVQGAEHREPWLLQDVSQFTSY
jgi:hypothetical protein